jgi:uncharacterized membrane protein (DUF2068 family)
MTALHIVAVLGVIAATVVVHLSGIALVLLRVRRLRKQNPLSRSRLHLHPIRLLLAVTLVIIVLHAIEVGIWAAFYRWTGAFADTETALYFSLGSYSTVGSAEVILPPRWRMLAGIEGVVGALMFGLSTAFIFSVLHAVDHLWEDHAQ